jgi:hypothetical protein
MVRQNGIYSIVHKAVDLHELPTVGDVNINSEACSSSYPHLAYTWRNSVSASFCRRCFLPVFSLLPI